MDYSGWPEEYSYDSLDEPSHDSPDVPLYDSPEETSLYRRFESHQDVYATYNFAARHNLLEHLRTAWHERTDFEGYMAEPLANIPYLCILFVCEGDTTTAAYRLAAQQISVREESLRNPAQYPVIHIAPQGPLVDYQSRWKALVRDTVTKLRPLTGGRLKVSENADADTCLQAIEGIRQLTSPAQRIYHVCFIAGLDSAYDRNLGYAITGDYYDKKQTEEGRAELEARYRLTLEDVAQRAKVARLAKALVRLFGAGGFGKLVFCVANEFSDPYLATFVGSTSHKDFTYWEKSAFMQLCESYYDS